MRLTRVPGAYAVARLGPQASLPSAVVEALAGAADFISVTRTGDETSIIARQELVHGAETIEPGWCALKVQGPLDFALTGVMASLAQCLADAGVSVFAMSTYDTDYLLVKKSDVDRACAALRASGHDVRDEDVPDALIPDADIPRDDVPDDDIPDHESATR